MADVLFSSSTVAFTNGVTFTYSHGLTAGGAAVVPDLVVPGVWNATNAITCALSVELIGATTTVCTVAVHCNVTQVGTVTMKNQYLHSIQRVV